MSTKPCARCGTAVAAGEHLCWRCRQELPVERPTRVAASGEGSPPPSGPPRQLWRGQPVPPGMVLPSRTQYHGTMYALIALGVAVTLTLAVLINKGVGPFVVSGVQVHQGTGNAAAWATGSVTNEGDRTGRARCVA